MNLEIKLIYIKMHKINNFFMNYLILYKPVANEVFPPQQFVPILPPAIPQQLPWKHRAL